MTTLHPFPMSRESVLPMWSHAAQARRSNPDARVSELFLLLHGMLFTNIQLDDFQPTLARFIERLDIEGAEERDWIMMAVINVSSVFEYGRPSGLLKKLGCVGTKEVNGPQAAAAMRVMAKKAAAGVPGSTGGSHGHHPHAVDEEKMDVDEEMRSPTIPSAEDALMELPAAFKFALQLTFAMLSHVLKKPTRKPSQYAGSTLNPYLTVLLTFLATVLKHKPTLDVMERSIPWADLASFFATIPRKIMISQGLMSHPDRPNSHRNQERWVMLTSGCPPPLDEDWCMRGMEWVGRKVFERGFWKSGEERKAELEVLQKSEGEQLTDGMIEDDDGEEDGRRKPSSTSDLVRRWVRIARSAVGIAGAVDGFSWVDGTREWSVEGKLAEKVTMWKEEDRIEREEEERRRMVKRWVDDPMDVDEEGEDSVSETSEDDENDSEEVKALKVCLYAFSCLNWCLLDFLTYRLDDDTSRDLSSPRRGMVPPVPHLRALQEYLVHRRKQSTADPSCRLCRATQSLSSTPTFFFHLYPWSPLSLRASSGPSLSLFLSSWSLMVSPPTRRNSAMPLKPPWPTSLRISVLMHYR